MTDFYEALRVLNVALAVLLMVGMVCRFGGFVRSTLPSKIGRLVVSGWTVLACLGTIEALGQSAAPGYRIPGATSVLLLTGYYMLVDWRDDRAARSLAARLLAADVVPAPREPARAY